MTADSPSSHACCAGSVGAADYQFAPECLDLFKVPLGCEAAAGLGCGVKAKPILQALAREPAVAQAWLNRSGTIVAVLWKEGISPRVRAERVRALLAEQGLAVRELTGAARQSTLRAFSPEALWYRGDAVDRLSEEEAAIIATRIVHRVTAKVPLSDGKVDALLAAIAEACKDQLINRSLTSARLRRQQIASAVVKATRKLLEGVELKALQAAVALGHRPIAGEN